MAPLLQEHNQ